MRVTGPRRNTSAIRCWLSKCSPTPRHAFDRGNKFAAYRKLESLQEYVLVDLAARRIELFRRNAEGHWVLYEYHAGDTIEFACSPRGAGCPRS